MSYQEFQFLRVEQYVTVVRKAICSYYKNPLGFWLSNNIRWNKLIKLKILLLIGNFNGVSTEENIKPLCKGEVHYLDSFSYVTIELMEGMLYKFKEIFQWILHYIFGKIEQSLRPASTWSSRHSKTRSGEVKGIDRLQGFYR